MESNSKGLHQLQFGDIIPDKQPVTLSSLTDKKGYSKSLKYPSLIVSAIFLLTIEVI